MEENQELTHYGILGMKWGKRRFQRKDGSLTNVGKQRYNDDLDRAKNNIKKATNEYQKLNMKKGSSYDDLKKASAEINYAKKDLSNIKIREKIRNQANKSKRQLNFEKKYTDQGLSKEEAEIAAYKRVRTEKIIAVTAGVTVAAVTAYVAYKQYDKRVDKIIKSGKQLQNISTNSNKGVTDAFFASGNRMDNTKYRGIYGNQLKKGPLGVMNNNVYETKIGIKSDLKLASKKSAANALSELLNKDSNFNQDLVNHLNNLEGQFATPKQNKVITDALKSLKSGKTNSKVYEALNLSLVEHSPTGQSVANKFYDTLKNKGYDAIKDINDFKYSGYKSSNPLIVFDGGVKTTVDSIRELGSNEINKSFKLGYADILGKSAIKSGAAYASIFIGATSVANSVKTKNNDKIVGEYRKKHPNSKLSYNDILRSHNS